MKSIESAINSDGEAAIFVGRLVGVPKTASVVGRRVILLGIPDEPVFRVAKETAQAIRSTGRLLVIQVEKDQIIGETDISINRSFRCKT